MSEQELRFTHSKPFDLTRKVVAHMTSLSWQHIPHVAYLHEPDITDFYKEFKALAEEKVKQGRKLSFNTIMLKLIAEGLKTAPELNAHIEYRPQQGTGILHICETINISIPYLLPDGRTITPVMYDVGTKSLDELSDAASRLDQKISRTNVDELLYRAVRADTSKELRRLNWRVIQRILGNFNQIRRLSGTAKADYYNIPEQERLTEKDLLNATVTVSNIGSLYKEQRGFFTLLEVVPPQIFVVGLGAVQEKPGIYLSEDGQKLIGIRKILPLCLVFDHRAIDFNPLIPFIKKLDEIFAEPCVMRGW